MKTLIFTAEKNLMRERLGKNSAQAIYDQADAVYRATKEKVADSRLTHACQILGLRLPWEPPETEVGLPPVPARTPEQKKRTAEIVRNARFGGYRI